MNLKKEKSSSQKQSKPKSPAKYQSQNLNPNSNQRNASKSIEKSPPQQKQRQNNENKKKKEIQVQNVDSSSSKKGRSQKQNEFQNNQNKFSRFSNLSGSGGPYNEKSQRKESTKKYRQLDSDSEQGSHNKDLQNIMKHDKNYEEEEDHIIDFENDYEPLRIGIKQDKLMIVINYQTPSNLKVYHHFIKLSKYINSQSLLMSISKSNSSSFRDLIKAEVTKVTHLIYKDHFHKDYLKHQMISRENHIWKLVRQILKTTIKMQKKKSSNRSSNPYSSQFEQSLGTSQTSVDMMSHLSQSLDKQSQQSLHRRQKAQIENQEAKQKLAKNADQQAQQKVQKGRKLSPGQNRFSQQPQIDNQQKQLQNQKTSEAQYGQQQKQSSSFFSKRDEKFLQQNMQANNYDIEGSGNIGSSQNSTSLQRQSLTTSGNKDMFDPLGIAAEKQFASNIQKKPAQKTFELPSKIQKDKNLSPPNLAQNKQNQNKQNINKQEDQIGGGLFQNQQKSNFPIQKQEMTSLQNLPPPVAKQNAIISSFDDDGWNDSDWNLDDVDKPAQTKKQEHEYQRGIDINSKDYQNQNLNKLNDEELYKWKRQMDKQFDQNFIKPNDPNFVYDKIVDFSKKKSLGSEDFSEQYSEDWN